MTKEELLAKLAKCKEDEDGPESGHSEADDALIEYINDPEIKAAYKAITRWFS